MTTASDSLTGFCRAATELIAQGVNGRGLAERLRAPTAAALADVARRLAVRAGRVGIVTGFFVPDAPEPVPETDGPLAAAVLADVLASCGHRVEVITDRFCATSLAAFFESVGVRIERLAVVGAGDTEPPGIGSPSDAVCANAGPDSARQLGDPERGDGESPSGDRWADYGVLLAIERAGPCVEPIAGAAAGQRASGVAARHLNIRGECIDHWCVDLTAVFEAASANGALTAAVGDGGNEIGFGCLHSDPALRAALSDWSGPVCRTATDRLIASDVSHWGGLALAAAVAFAAAAPELLDGWPSGRQADALREAAARRWLVDGITRRFEATIDAVPLQRHLVVWERLTQLVRIHRS